MFSAFAHAFRWFNTSFCHDSLIVYQNDGIWQLFIGRWLVPFWLLVRGTVASPWLISILSVLFLSLAIVLLVNLIGIRRLSLALPVSAVLASCPVVTCLFAGFISATDLHTLSFLLSILSVFILARVKKGVVPAAVLLALSMALYQTYLEVALVLVIFLLIRQLVQEESLTAVKRFVVRSFCYFALGGSLYIVIWLVSIWMLGYSPATLPTAGDYNDLGTLSGLLKNNVWNLGVGAYKSAADYIMFPETKSSGIIGALNLLLCLLAIVRIAFSAKEWNRRLICLGLVAILPLAANFVFILSGGTAHTLMVMSLVMLYAGVVMTSAFHLNGVNPRIDRITRISILAVTALVAFNFTVFANQTHLRVNLEEQSTLSAITRVLDRVENSGEFTPGGKVVLVGALNTSPIFKTRDGFESTRRRHTPLRSNFSVTYLESYQNYFNNILSYPVVIAGRDETMAFSNMPEVIQMPSFPAPGCVRKVGDALVVKLSDIQSQNYASD